MSYKDKTIENSKIQHALINIFKVSLSNKPIVELVKTSHKELIKLMGKEKAKNFYLAIYEGNYMYNLPYYYDEYDKEPINKPISLKGGLTDYIRRKGSTELIDKKRQKELIEKGEIKVIGTDSLEWIGAPLEYHNKIHGVLTIQTYNKEIKYTKEDVELITYVSKNLSLAVDRKKRDSELKEYRRKLEKEIKEKSKEIVEKNKKLIESRKMEAIGILSAGISHEFNNILSIIMGNVQMGIKQCKPDDMHYKRYKKIEKSSKRACEIIEKLMLFTEHRKKIKYFVNDISKIIETSIVNLKNSLKKSNKPNIQLITNIEKNLDKVNVDKEDIHFALKSMYNKAIDALPDKGTITITAKNFKGIPPRSDLHLKKYIHISIRDNGIGMNEKTKNNIFTPFFVTKDSGKWTGIGFAEVYIIIKEHEGYIAVESKIGKGTIINIYLHSAKNKLVI